MSELPTDLASVDWLYVAELYALVFLSTLIGTLALMFAAVLFFWTYYPDDLITARSVAAQKVKIRKRLRQFGSSMAHSEVNDAKLWPRLRGKLSCTIWPIGSLGNTFPSIKSANIQI